MPYATDSLVWVNAVAWWLVRGAAGGGGVGSSADAPGLGCCGCSAAGAGRLALVRVCARCRVLIGDVADGDGLVAVGAQAAEVDADAGSVAFVAPLLAEVADAAFGALVDGDAASGGAWWQRDDRWGCLVMVAGAPGGLAAGG